MGRILICGAGGDWSMWVFYKAVEWTKFLSPPKFFGEMSDVRRTEGARWVQLSVSMA